MLILENDEDESGLRIHMECAYVLMDPIDWLEAHHGRARCHIGRAMVRCPLRLGIHCSDEVLNMILIMVMTTLRPSTGPDNNIILSFICSHIQRWDTRRE